VTRAPPRRRCCSRTACACRRRSTSSRSSVRTRRRATSRAGLLRPRGGPERSRAMRRFLQQE
jgi:hypothetical protein